MTAVILSGHIRDSFKNRFLSTLISLMNADVFIHTWNVDEANQSWRELSKNKNNVTKDMVTSYFPSNRVKNITIEGENVHLHGRTNGLVNDKIKIPIKCQKQMWYGITRSLTGLKNPSNYKYVIRLRFDMHKVTHYFRDHKANPCEFYNNIINPMMRHIDTGKDICVLPSIGVDNVFAMKPSKALSIVNAIYYNYDSTVLHPKNSNIYSQEYNMVIYLKFVSKFKVGMLIKINGKRLTCDISELGIKWVVPMKLNINKKNE